jgi:hypothetical protein
MKKGFVIHYGAQNHTRKEKALHDLVKQTLTKEKKAPLETIQ